MREHPVPQDVTGYQFHIVGNMTIKQFAMVAGGAFVAFLIYTTNLPTLIKWSLMAGVAGLGALAAFVPIEEQPIDHWIITFVRTLYKPTKYYWRRNNKLPDFLRYTPPSDSNTNEVAPSISPDRREQVKAYLSSVNISQQPDEYDRFVISRVGQLHSMFDLQPPIGLQQINSETPVQISEKIPDNVVTQNSYQVEHQEKVYLDLHGAPELLIADRPQSTQKKIVQTDIVQGEYQIPTQQMIQIAVNEDDTHQRADDTNQTTNLMADDPVNTFLSGQEQTQTDLSDMSSTVTNSSLPFPTPPTEPNKLVGMVLGPNQDILDNAVVEVKNQQGQTVRAVKTNALGQFFVTTPLPVGEYIIATDRDGFQFSNTTIKIDGSILPPVEIRGK